MITTQQRQSIRYQESRAKQFLFLTKSGVDAYNAAIISGYGEVAAQQIAEGIATQMEATQQVSTNFEPGQVATNESKNAVDDKSMETNPLKDSSYVPDTGDNPQ